ncbi:hypothetical protein A0H81_01460 [Grifola frondosa]|uniref:Uncharacterized protein n=1 Tax=Grifola frondosa TaxID=5627 RepID=A0A1C7MPD9_GRIFR|nr:hypothetical protein A0H81_01460 [Grifola frondosa]
MVGGTQTGYQVRIPETENTCEEGLNYCGSEKATCLAVDCLGYGQRSTDGTLNRRESGDEVLPRDAEGRRGGIERSRKNDGGILTRDPLKSGDVEWYKEALANPESSSQRIQCAKTSWYQ